MASLMDLIRMSQLGAGAGMGGGPGMMGAFRSAGIGPGMGGGPMSLADLIGRFRPGGGPPPYGQMRQGLSGPGMMSGQGIPGHVQMVGQDSPWSMSAAFGLGPGPRQFGSAGEAQNYAANADANAFINTPGGPADLMRQRIAANAQIQDANRFRPYQMPGMADMQSRFASMISDPGLWSGMQSAVANRYR